MRSILAILMVLPCWVVAQSTSAGKFTCQDGAVYFRSDAPLEVIEARSNKLRGIIDPVQKTFAWSLDINSFTGFNSALQREHFKENYMETTRFPSAFFKGKIIESTDLSTPQKITIRAKGILTIHGVDQERIIKVTVDIEEKAVLIQADFTISLSDHDINIPRIVNQKIAEDVKIRINAKLLKS